MVRTTLQCLPYHAKEDVLKALKTTTIAMFTALALAAVSAGLFAQQPGFKRTVLQQQKLSVAGREAVTAIAEFQPGGTVGAHTHPGEEIGYILEGSIVLEQDGKSVTLTAGQTFFIPNGQVHNATNKGSSTARVLANYVVESGKPVATPVAAK
jgi:quercetin dioxygenase-like cupin family protein